MKKYLSIAFLSIAFLGMSANAQNLQDFIDYTESDNQLTSEAYLEYLKKACDLLLRK